MWAFTTVNDLINFMARTFFFKSLASDSAPDLEVEARPKLMVSAKPSANVVTGIQSAAE